MKEQHKEYIINLVSKLTLDNKINLMCQYQDSIPELGIKKYKHGTEASHGIAWLGKATMFPQPIGLACTWDKDLLKEIGTVIGTEARGFFHRDPENNGLTLWAPTIDMNRDPRWGRTDEGYGEDPVLTGNLAAALINGIQGDNENTLRAIATLKHFYGNNNEKDRGFSSTNISERIKREYYLKVFKIVMDNSRVLSMMTAYNSINGIPANVHPDLQNIVRDEWKWPGFIVSDAGDVLSLIHEHKLVDNPEEAVAMSIKSGIDSITDDHDISKKAIKDGLKSEILTENDLDRALYRTFYIRSLLGEFTDDEKNPYSCIKEDVIGVEAHSKVAQKASVKSIVLLKNSEKILPLTSPDSSIAVIGNLADRVYRDWYSGEFLYEIPGDKGLKKYYSNTQSHDGNDRVTIQDKETKLYLHPDGKFRLKASIFEMEDWGWGAVTFKSEENKKYLTSGNDSISANADSIWGWFTKEVFYTKIGDSVEFKTWNTSPVSKKNDRLSFKSDGESDGEIGISASTPLGPVSVSSGNFMIKKVSNGIEKVVKMASEAKIPIVIIGNHPLINGKETIDRHDIALPSRQAKLAEKIVEANENAILILVGSYPFAIGELKNKYKTILYTSHLGQETGNAIKKIISGNENPSGRLPITWYKSKEDLGDIMDYELPEVEKTYLYYKGDVEYPFGHGLSYSQFTYSEFVLDSEKISSNDEIKISFQITNNGPWDGDEVIQIYLKHSGTMVKRPIKQLTDFSRVFIKNQESRKFKYSIPAQELQYWNEEESKFLWETGTGEIIIGSSSEKVIIKQNLILI